MQTQITDLTIKSTKHPPAGHVMLWDTVTRGFGCRIGKQTKTFLVLIGGGRRQTIGRYPTWTLSKARDEARKILAEKELGQVKPTFTAYEDAKNEYLEDCRAKNRESTYRGYKWRLDNQLDFKRANIADIKPRDVLNKLKVTDAPAERRYIFIVARSFFNWCVAQHYLDASPMARLTVPPKGDSRDRVLSPDELKAIWQACPDDAYGNVVKLLMLTGQRRGEIEHLTLSDDLATLPAAYAKNRRPHTFPVGPIAAELLQKPRKWGGWGKSKSRLDTASRVQNWALHDLRRTYSTIQASLGTPPHITERLLNHLTGTISGVSAVYNRFAYVDEMRKAVLAYETRLAAILELPKT